MKYSWYERMEIPRRRNIWVAFFALVALGVAVGAALPDFHIPEIMIVFLAGAWGITYFLVQQHFETACFFKELVTEFNRRFDCMNGRLLDAIKKEGEFSEVNKKAFVDYLNLCAEEYLFHREGYIYAVVWYAWWNGMKQFGRDPRVAEVWEQEVKTDSYYGFKFPTGAQCKVD